MKIKQNFSLCVNQTDIDDFHDDEWNTKNTHTNDSPEN